MISVNIQININKGLYLKDPNSSELGRKIILNSIILINKLGFEKFTFKKLSIKINSPESSIYRYFENKHTLLIYLIGWYWSWIEYQILLAITNIELPKDRLKKAIQVITNPVLKDKSDTHINKTLLNKIIITESVKAFHTKDIDLENKKGCFEPYKRVVNNIAKMVLEVNSTYKYSHMLITTVIEGSQQQQYYANHLPSLTDKSKKENIVSSFYQSLVFKMIQ